MAALGLARSLCEDETMRTSPTLLELQRALFVVGADLATNPNDRGRLTAGVSLVTADMTEDLERRIDAAVAQRPLPDTFIVPGSTPASAALDVARGVVRRAERRVVGLAAEPGTNPEVARFLNRLSDLLFVLARSEAVGPEPASRTDAQNEN